MTYFISPLSSYSPTVVKADAAGPVVYVYLDGCGATWLALGSGSLEDHAPLLNEYVHVFDGAFTHSPFPLGVCVRAEAVGPSLQVEAPEEGDDTYRAMRRAAPSQPLGSHTDG